MVSITYISPFAIIVEPLQWIPMGEDSVTLPPGDDAAMEVLTPIGFTIGDTLHHNIYVRW